MVERNKPPELDGALIVDDKSARVDDEDEALSPEEDGKAELALEMLGEILEHMGLDVDIEIRTDSDEIVLDLQGEDTGRVIRKKGQTLDALQFLVNEP